MILGPTASGKSALSLKLAQILRSEIISLDSALVYRGMDVGTAKPSKEELAICPHHLIDICDPSESYSAANFRNDCIRLVGEIRARGALPIICGGTMMYYKALVDGLSPLPETSPEVRAQVQAMADAEGWPSVHEKLKTIDPPLYQKLAPLDKQRVARARALVNNPRLLIADEPTGNIDPELSFEIVELLNEINRCGTTVVMVTHEHELVSRFNRRVITINHGNVVGDGGIDDSDEWRDFYEG